MSREPSYTVASLAVIITVLCHLNTGDCSRTLSYVIDEELPVGSLVGDVRRDAFWLSDQHSPTVFQSLGFVLLRSSGGSNSVERFTIDETSGQIRIADVIDREAICPRQVSPCVIRVDVAIQPAAHFAIIRADVTIRDVNDNPPSFAVGSHFRLIILESSAVGATFTLPVATDDDDGENGAIEYHLIDESGNFRLVVRKNRRSTSEAEEVRLELVKQLDRERQDRYQLTLTATDGGRPPLTGSVVVDVVVGDVNDNAPRFERTEYQVDVPEDAPIGTTLVRMRATDADVGANAHVRYAFSTRSSVAYGNLFAIDPETGNVVLLQSLAYAPGDVTAAYQLSVVAEDGGPFPLPAIAALVVRVVDVNNHAPRITVDAMSGSAAADTSSGSAQPEVPENSAVGTFVAHVTASDADAGENGEVSCELVKRENESAPEDFKLEEIYDGEYKLLTAREFDREVNERAFAAIRCQDGGRPPRSTTRNITVTITDVNDRAPVFTEEFYDATIPENSPWGTVVTRVAAFDADAGENGRVTYLLDRRDSSGMAGRRFHVDPDTGVVTTLSGLDREVADVIEFGVVASDAGSSPRRHVSRAVVRVRVTDVDDESPTFLRADYVFTVAENQPAGTRVGHVTAVDLDAPPFDAFSYRIRDADAETDAVNFRLDPVTGSIFTTTQFDREERRTYRMSVVAQSDTVRARSDVAVVTVRVSDVNDNSPVFKFPNRVNHTVFLSVMERQRGGDGDSESPLLVTVCEATDADEGLNARISYDLLPGSRSDAVFQIDAASGRLTYDRAAARKRRARAARNSTFAIVVRATDAGTPSLSSTETLFVVVSAAGVDSAAADGLVLDETRPSQEAVVTSDRVFGDNRVLGAVADWLTDGGVVIVAASLASIATLVVVLFVAVCLARARSRRRRRQDQRQQAVVTKIELQTTGAPPEDVALLSGTDRLLRGGGKEDDCCVVVANGGTGRLYDVTLNDYAPEPVRYVCACPLTTTTTTSSTTMTSSSSTAERLQPPVTATLLQHQAAPEHDADSGCGDVSNSDDCASSNGSNHSSADGTCIAAAATGKDLPSADIGGAIVCRRLPQYSGGCGAGGGINNGSPTIAVRLLPAVNPRSPLSATVGSHQRSSSPAVHRSSPSRGRSISPTVYHVPSTSANNNNNTVGRKTVRFADQPSSSSSDCFPRAGLDPQPRTIDRQNTGGSVRATSPCFSGFSVAPAPSTTLPPPLMLLSPGTEQMTSRDHRLPNTRVSLTTFQTDPVNPVSPV